MTRAPAMTRSGPASPRWWLPPAAAGSFAVACSALLALGVAWAWACVPQANLVTLQPRSSGPAGSEVTVSGVNLDRGEAEIRWNAVDGPLLAKAQGPNLEVPVKIPDAAAGLYLVVVLSRQPSGVLGNTVTTPFQVLPPAGAGGQVVASVGPSRPAPTAAAPSRSTIGALLLLLLGAGLLAVGLLAGRFLTSRRQAAAQRR